MTRTPAARSSQHGVILLEALIGILIFSIGILGLMGLQAASIKSTTEARYRSEAGYLASQIVGRMWADRSNLANYALAAGTTCNIATTTALMQWLCQVETTLPGVTAAANRPTIIVAADTVTVTLMWRYGPEPADTTIDPPRRHTVITRIN